MSNLDSENDPTVYKTDMLYRGNKLVTTIPYQENQLCIGSYEVEGEAIEGDKHPNYVAVQSEGESPPLSGVQSQSDLDRQYRKDSGAFFNDLQNNLEAMLNDVINTNRQAKSVSSFLSIPAFVGFLSKLAFNKNPSFPDKNADGLKYVRFLERFVLGNNAWANTRVENQNGDIPGIATVLYCMVRCGLLHGATLTDSKPAFDDITIKLTHQQHALKTLAEYDAALKKRKTSKAPIEIVLNAFDLCDELRKSLVKMFNECNSDFDLATSIQAVYKDEPTFSFYKNNAFSVSSSTETDKDMSSISV